MYYKLACTAQEFLDAPHLFKMDCDYGNYSNVFSFEETAELGRIFSQFFDMDTKLKGAELQSMMSTVGIIMTQEESREFAQAMAGAVNIDKIDNERVLSNEAFFQWYANQLGKHNDTKKCGKFFFDLFDDDDSGDITVLEFKQQLGTLKLGITHAEANEMIEELDQDGNGVLSEDEFEEMIKNYWPLESEELVG